MCINQEIVLTRVLTKQVVLYRDYVCDGGGENCVSSYLLRTLLFNELYNTSITGGISLDRYTLQAT